MKVVKVTSKGQVTIPVEVRAALGIDKDSYLEVPSGPGLGVELDEDVIQRLANV